jgi:hypothetical protein
MNPFNDTQWVPVQDPLARRERSRMRAETEWEPQELRVLCVRSAQHLEFAIYQLHD